MGKRFKGRKVKKRIVLNVVCFLLLTFFSFNLFYNLIYNIYLAKLDNKTVIEHILLNTKNGSGNNFFRAYQNPTKIINDNFVVKKDESSINVSLEEKVPSVYIYSTHDTESYNDRYFEVYNIKPTVKTISYILSDYLEDLGIRTVVESRSVADTLKAHGWSYRYSYEASRELITDAIGQGNYKLIIDLHRDSSILDKTILNYNGKNYARILFVVGAEHAGYEVNHALAIELNTLFEGEIPGISRGISVKSGNGVNGIYNQDLNKKMVLLEMGGQYNEIEELNNTIEVTARVILKYLEGNNEKQ